MIDAKDMVGNWTRSPVVPIQDHTVTTQMLRDLCAQMDAQAFGVAITGLVLSIITLFYFGRIRYWIRRQSEMGCAPTWLVPFLDKFLLTGIAMCFVILIVRMMRAGL